MKRGQNFLNLLYKIQKLEMSFKFSRNRRKKIYLFKSNKNRETVPEKFMSNSIVRLHEA